MGKTKVKKLRVIVGRVCKVAAITCLVGGLLNACKKVCSPCKAKSHQATTEKHMATAGSMHGANPCAATKK